MIPDISIACVHSVNLVVLYTRYTKFIMAVLLPLDNEYVKNLEQAGGDVVFHRNEGLLLIS